MRMPRLDQSATTKISAATSAPGTTDPAAYGEDVLHNFKRATALTPKACTTCNGYHMVHTAKRLAGQTVWERNSRTPFLNALKSIFAKYVARDVDRIDTVVAACADTAMLSTLAHAAREADGVVFERSRITVLDKCRIPLTLCEDYAARNGFQIRTAKVDLLDTSDRYPADVITLHNFLPFVPEASHQQFLRMLGSWLKEAGRMVIWNPVLQPDDQDRSKSGRRVQGAKVMEMIDSGAIEISLPKDEFRARLSDNLEDPRLDGQRFVDFDALPNLIQSAGLEVLSVDEIRDDGGYRTQLNTIVVAGQPAPSSSKAVAGIRDRA